MDEALKKLIIWRDTLTELNQEKARTGDLTDEMLIKAHTVMDFHALLIVVTCLADAYGKQTGNS